VLNLVEEILLLSLHDETGAFRPLPEYSLELAASGGVLMDLALRDRIDADMAELTVTDPSPTGDPLLDPVLRELAESSRERNLRQWLTALARVPFLREQALERLVDRGILARVDQKRLWLFASRRYPTLDPSAQQRVVRRVLGLLGNDEIPDPRDVALICLAHACGLFPSVLSKEAVKAHAPRIRNIARMDLIGRQMLLELTGLRASVDHTGWWGVGDAPLDLEARLSR